MTFSFDIKEQKENCVISLRDKPIEDTILLKIFSPWRQMAETLMLNIHISAFSNKTDS